MFRPFVVVTETEDVMSEDECRERGHTGGSPSVTDARKAGVGVKFIFVKHVKKMI